MNSHGFQPMEKDPDQIIETDPEGVDQSYHHSLVIGGPIQDPNGLGPAPDRGLKPTATHRLPLRGKEWSAR